MAPKGEFLRAHFPHQCVALEVRYDGTPMRLDKCNTAIQSDEMIIRRLSCLDIRIKCVTYHLSPISVFYARTQLVRFFFGRC